MQDTRDTINTHHAARSPVMSRRRVLGWLAAAGGALSLPWGIMPARAAGEFIRLPTPLPVPPFDLPSLSGERIRLANYLGRVIIVNFWIWWCPSCKRELQELQWLWQAHPHTRLMVFGVHVGGRVGKARAFVEKAGISFPILMDRRNEVAHNWGVTRYPMSVVLGRDAKAHYVIYGSRQWNDEEATKVIGGLLTS